MTQRSIRRAQERQALKKMGREARKTLPSEAPIAASPTGQIHTPGAMEAEAACAQAETQSRFSPAFDCNCKLEDVPTRSRSFKSTARTAANQANAQLSTGPNSTEGKSTSSLNAVKTALTGRTVLLNSDDAAAYQRHIEAWQHDLQPVGVRECDLVQSIADSAWRLQRIPCLENAIFALGHIEFTDSFNDHAPDLRISMIELHTFLKYEKQLRNLQIQEARLASRRRKDLAELCQLQQQRRTAEGEAQQAALELAAEQYLSAKSAGQAFETTPNGFVFSTAQIELYLERTQTCQLQAKARPHAA
jgi:hypothetical protein